MDKNLHKGIFGFKADTLEMIRFVGLAISVQQLPDIFATKLFLLAKSAYEIIMIIIKKNTTKAQMYNFIFIF